jgi:hypothetical protein
MAKNTTTTTTATVYTLDNLVAVIEALTPAAVLKMQGLPAIAREVRVEARVSVLLANAAIREGRPCEWAAFAIVLSDGTALPFKVWSDGILGIREGGKAHAVSAR